MFSSLEPWKPLVESALSWLKRTKGIQGLIQPSVYPIKPDPEKPVFVPCCADTVGTYLYYWKMGSWLRLRKEFRNASNKQSEPSQASRGFIKRKRIDSQNAGRPRRTATAPKNKEV